MALTKDEAAATAHARLSAKLVGFDPATIIAIISAILKALELCWPKPAELKASAANGGTVLQKVAIRRQLAAEGVPIRERAAATAAAFTLAAEATEDELRAFQECCSKD